jgi:vacuolar-type H+-ATPase subunit I/STV1
LIEQKEVDNEEILEEVQPQHFFWAHNGQQVRNLVQLKDALETMSNETFQYHVTSERNDFSNWVRDVIKDEMLAQKLAEVRSRGDMIKVLVEKLRKKEENKVHTKEEKKEKSPEILFSIKKITANIKNILPKKKEEQPREVLEVEDVTGKIEEILMKEKEIEKREQKIQEIEARIEKKLVQGTTIENKFFSKEFVQGIIVGVLVSLIIWLIYVRLIA